MSIVIPDSITPSVGWKAFDFSPSKDLLISPSMDLVWNIKEKVQAKCSEATKLHKVWAMKNQKGETFPTKIFVPKSVQPYGLSIEMHGEESTAKPKTILPSGWEWIVITDVRRFDSSPPHKDCTCGIYAANSFDGTISYSYSSNSYSRDATKIFGQIYGWGRVIEGSSGFRCEFAYPKELFVVNKKRGLRNFYKKLLEKYEVPVHIFKSVNDLEDIFNDKSPPLPSSTNPMLFPAKGHSWGGSWIY